MTFYEIGDKGNPAVLLIHGMGCNSERSFSKPAKALSKKYRMIMVNLDGYDGKGTTFTTISDQAKKIAAFLHEQYEGKLYACVGMSMGGFIAMDLVCRYEMNIEHLVLDSGYVPPMPFAAIFSKLTADGFMQLLRRLLKTDCRWIYAAIEEISISFHSSCNGISDGLCLQKRAALPRRLLAHNLQQ